MRKTTLLVLVIALVCSISAQSPAPPAVDVLAADIQAVVKQAPPTSVADQPIRVVDAGGYNVGVFVVTRPKASRQGAILHDNKVSEIYYMLEGAGTLVTGGTLVDQKRVQPDSRTVTDINGPSISGSRIDGGVRRRIAKGDVVIIPGYVPHSWSEIESDISYLVFRPDPDGILKRK
jgi:uncharacterized RmlC-like cupin family protein